MAHHIVSISDFPRLKVLDDAPPDHHYFNIRYPNPASASTLLRIKEEWRRLEAGNLPESIYVRAYTTGKPLLRAAIVGAPGTPYHNSLHLFDIRLKNKYYPKFLPIVYYHSFNLHINPRLSSSGRVYLSLLNTLFPGRWNTGIFIVQVVLAIHTLVSERRPYFLNPACAGHRGDAYSEEESDKYNEKVYVRCCRSTLCLLQKPPASDLEPLVTAHFGERAVEILTVCNKYRLASIGSFVEIAQELKIKVSSRYKRVIDEVYAGLVGALFVRYGELVEDFVNELADERVEKVEEEAKKKEKRAQNGIHWMAVDIWS